MAPGRATPPFYTCVSLPLVLEVQAEHLLVCVTNDAASRLTYSICSQAVWVRSELESLHNW
eukprot:2939542-Amphidinium_carterae.1